MSSETDKIPTFAARDAYLVTKNVGGARTQATSPGSITFDQEGAIWIDLDVERIVCQVDIKSIDIGAASRSVVAQNRLQLEQVSARKTNRQMVSGRRYYCGLVLRLT